MEFLKSAQKPTVGIALSQSGLLELVQVDKNTKKVVKYANRQIVYNVQNRQIADIEEFRTNLLLMFQEVNISSKCNVILSMPSVLFGMSSLPLILNDDAIDNAILAEIEQSYLFKNTEAVISWQDCVTNNKTETRNLVYSAFQTTEAQKILDVFKDIGASVVAIEDDSLSLFKGLDFAGVTRYESTSEEPWAIILVNQNSFSIFSFIQNKIVNYFSEAVAIRSLTADEIYTTLQDSIESQLSQVAVNNILVISESDEIDAEVIADKLSFHGSKKFLNQNKYNDKQIMDVDFSVLPNYINQISLTAVGTALYYSVDYPIKFNLLPNASLEVASNEYILECFGKEYSVTKEYMQAFVIAILIVVTAISGCIYGLLKYFNNNLNAEIAKVQNNIQNTQKSIESLKESEKEEGPVTLDLGQLKSNVETQNLKSLMYYAAIAYNIPRSTWITGFMVNSKGAVAIEGKASHTSKVYEFFRSVKSAIPESDISLTKLKFAVGYDDLVGISDRLLYDFTLSNSLFSPSLDSLSDSLPSVEDLLKKNQPQQVVSDDNNLAVPKQAPPSAPATAEDANKALQSTGSSASDANKSGMIRPRETEKLMKKDVDENNKIREAKKEAKAADDELPDLPPLK